MADNPVLLLFLPLALAVVMAGLGLHLTPADFRRVLALPKAMAVALAVQLLLLPPVAFGLARAFGLPGELALGLVLLAASPGGVTANLFSHLARGDVALNISLTAINSLLALVTLPLWAALALSVFLGDEASVPPPTRKIVEVALLVIGPVALGMALRAWRPALAAAAEKPVRHLSSLLLGALIVMAFASEWDIVRAYAPVVGVAAVLFNLASLLSGYFVARGVRLAEPQAIAIAFEIGIHNGTLAIFIAIEVLGRDQASIAPAIYALSMYLTGALFAAWLLHRRKDATT
ncbi:bile acid:sodium symporter family protein [Arenimonas caeni]|jgi:BASS family bile acid:Na+ symporter|uniref:bile acid:sodium symporter family protein n=1 Tax=Arenimonas caeni TaxID=2058085 RepID=UPI002A35B58D|nr:bile acid:sodium symporter family protein [Arenimonas caeni]MDY0022301.1 bile acid:sodium symporter family protein [Arenimonas caeni]